MKPKRSIDNQTVKTQAKEATNALRTTIRTNLATKTAKEKGETA